MISTLKRAWRAVGLLIAVCVFVPSVGMTATELSFPPLSGRVVDQARLLQPQARDAITAKLAQLETDTGDQLVVVTVPSLQDHEIEDYGYRLGRAWGIGQKENDGGALLIIAPNERKVRIEVGYGLEPVLTDALSTQIIQTDILPPFREGGYQRGITAGVDAIITQLRLDPAEARARAATVKPKSADTPGGSLAIVALIFFFILMGSIRSAGYGGRRRRGGLGSVLMWGAADAFRSGSDGGFGGGSGGGFSGGGGSFGGGGASGGW